MPDTDHNPPPIPAIGVAAVVFDPQGKVLLIKRGQPPAAGWWSIPGGKQQANESLAEACRREVREETGLAVELAGIIAVVERRSEGFHYVIIDFLARPADINQLDLIAATDVTESAWVGLEQLAHYPLVPGLAEIIQRASLLGVDGQAGLQDADDAATDYVLS